jgi:serine/threonine-protein kinase PRP4
MSLRLKGMELLRHELSQILTLIRSWNTAEIKSDDVVEPEALDEAALIEQRRKRREAIKAKYRGAATPMMVQALQLGEKSGDNTPRASELNRENTAASTREGTSTSSRLFFSTTDTLQPASPFLSTPATPKDIQDLSAFSITTDQDLANKTSVTTNVMDDGPSAADYDPTIDMQEDKERDIKRHAVEMPSSAYDETKQGSGQDILIPQSPKTAEAATEKSKNEFDMFADDDDDMFAEDTDTVKPANAEQGAAAAIPVPEAKVLDVGMLDNWDDAEGYYKTILGELLDGRYHVTANLGRGMFAAVVRATDITTKKIVAIKIIRKNETM